MDYKTMAQEILELAGGRENVLSLVNCATRLRFSLRDGGKFQTDGLKKVKGVMGAMFTGGQYQVIIGTDVNHVYDEMIGMTGLEGGTVDAVEKADLKANPNQNKGGRMAAVMDVISSLFTPAIAAITGAAMIKVVLVILTMTGLMESGGQTYQMFSLVGDAPFYFMPVILAYTSAVMFGVDPMVGMTIGLCMVNPTY